MRKILPVVHIIFLIIAILSGIFYVNTKADLIDEDALVSHDPIFIEGNDNFTSSNGVVSGSGSAEDPYIIENWDINAQNAHGIEIRDTHAYFIIRNCWVHDGHGRPPTINDKNGIHLDNVKNGIINNFRGTNNGHGMYLFSSQRIEIHDTSLHLNHHHGIYLKEKSKGNSIYNNSIVLKGKYGICLEYGSSGNSIVNNNISTTDWAVIKLYAYSNNNLISDNNIESARSGYGIYLEGCQNNSIVRNFIRSIDGEGIRMRGGADNNIILYNEIVDTDGAILILRCSENLISNNILKNNSLGIVFSSSFNNIIFNNNLTQNGYGVLLNETDYFLGIFIEVSSDNYIFHNNFMNNKIQAYDNTGNNHWYVAYPSGGNYWSNYTGIDEYKDQNQQEEGKDGFGDTLWDIDGHKNSKDRYPLMNPWPLGMENTDSDCDGLPDDWELQYFSNLSQGLIDDYDRDGFSNLIEYNAGTNPTEKTDLNGINDNDTELFLSQYWWMLCVIIVIIILIMALIRIKHGKKGTFTSLPQQETQIDHNREFLK